MCFTLALMTTANTEDCVNHPNVIFKVIYLDISLLMFFFCEELASNKHDIHVLVLTFCYNCHCQLKPNSFMNNEQELEYNTFSEMVA